VDPTETAHIDQYLAELVFSCSATDRRLVVAYVDRLHGACRRGARIFLFGNGGSAATAAHHATDLMKAGSERLPVKALALGHDVATATATANDVNFSAVFSYPLSVLADASDMVVAFSCSGTSSNVVSGCQLAKDLGLSVIAFTGTGPSTLAELADIHFGVPSRQYGIVEDVHLVLAHISARLLRERIHSASEAGIRGHAAASLSGPVPKP
jgi:D-sedoheptulose 7-phosphate isomerase